MCFVWVTGWIQVEPEESQPTRDGGIWEADLEVVCEHDDAIILLPRCHDEIEPRVVVPTEMPFRPIAIEVLFTTDDRDRVVEF